MVKKSLSLLVLGIVMFSCSGGEKNEVKEETQAKEVVQTVETSQEQKEQTEIQEPVESTTTDCTTTLDVYLNDPDLSGTNIRKSPKGEKLTQIVKQGEDAEFFITVTESKAGWFKISTIEDMEGKVEMDYSSAWIYGGVLGVNTRNYGNQTINVYSNANSTKIIGTITSETYGLSLVDLCGDWVRVRNKNVDGWVKKEWLCGNPLTTCA